VISPRVATIGQMIITVVLVLLKDPRYLPALLVLQFTPQDFRGGVGANLEGQYERFDALVIFIAGFPFTPNYALLLSLFFRVSYDLVTTPMAYARRPGFWLLPLWVLALVLSLYNSFLGRFHGYYSWTVPIRLTLSFLAIWYGVSLAGNTRAFWFTLRSRLPLIGLVTLGLGLFGLFSNRLTWLLLSLMSVLPFVLLADGKRPLRLPQIVLAALMLLTSTATALGFRFTGMAYEEVALPGEGALSTLTTILLFGLSLALAIRSFVANRRGRSLRFSPFAITLLYVLYMLIPFVIPTITAGVDVENKNYRGTDTIANRMAYKLLWERAALWRGAVDQIKEPPYIFVPSGRPGYIIMNSGRRYEWFFGAHNIVLYVLQLEGILLGAVSLFFVYVALVAGAYGYQGNPLRTAQVCGTCVLGMVFATGFGGMALAEPAVSFFVFSFAGACLAAPRPTPRHVQQYRDGGSSHDQ
jgi:hypothetical protein